MQTKTEHPQLSCSGWTRALGALLLSASLVGPAFASHAAKILFVQRLLQRDTVKLINILKAQGHEVTIVAENTEAVLTASEYAAQGYQLLIVDEVISSGNVGDRFRNSPIPVINWEGYLYSGNRSAYNADTGLTGGNYATAAEAAAANGGAGADHGQVLSETAINIVLPSHPLAAGLPAGSVNVFDPNTPPVDADGAGVITFAGARTLISGATVVATVPGFDNGRCVFGVDVGVLNADGTSANQARWVHLPWNDTDTAERVMIEPSFFLFEAAVAWAMQLPQPTKIHNLLPESAGFVATNTAISFSVDKTTASGSAVPQGNIQLKLNGTNVIGSATITDGGSAWNVSYTQPLKANANYTIIASATAADGGFSARMSQIDTFDLNNYSFEAEDFNFGGGQYFDNIVLCDTLGGGTDGCYFDRVGWTNIDQNEINFTTAALPVTNEVYRFGAGITREVFVDTFITQDGLVRAKYTAAGLPDYEVRNIVTGEWLNYTRTFPAGTYNIYARVSSANAMTIQLDLVDDGASATQTTTNKLGRFVRDGGTAGYELVPLTDDTGASPLVVEFDGTPHTIRVTALSDGFTPNFYMLVPTAAPVNQPPTSEITSPAAYFVGTEGTPITIEVNATDDSAVAKVDFYAGISEPLTLVGSDAVAPYSQTFTPPALGAVSDYTIRAVATDNKGLTGQTNITIRAIDPNLVVVWTSDGVGADSELRENDGGDSANGTGQSMNTRITITTGTTNRHEVIGLRFDLGTNDLSMVSSPQINMVSFRALSARDIHVYGVIDGTVGLDNNGVTRGFTDNDWVENQATFSTMPGLVWDGEEETRGFTNVVDLGVLNLGLGKGGIWSFSSSALLDFLKANPDNIVTFLLEQDTDNTGQSRFATKEATALDGGAPVGPAGWFAPYLSFRVAGAEPIPLNIVRSGNDVVLSWTDSSFALQAAPAVTGTYTNVADATSPHTLSIGSMPMFFRLKAN